MGGAGAVTMWFLDATHCRGRFAGCLGGEMLAGGLAAGGFAGRLLGAGHGG